MSGGIRVRMAIADHPPQITVQYSSTIFIRVQYSFALFVNKNKNKNKNKNADKALILHASRHVAFDYQAGQEFVDILAFRGGLSAPSIHEVLHVQQSTPRLPCPSR